MAIARCFGQNRRNLYKNVASEGSGGIWLLVPEKVLKRYGVEVLDFGPVTEEIALMAHVRGIQI